MSYPSLNARAAGLPPIAKPARKHSLLPAFKFQRRSSLDLPIQMPPRPDLAASAPSTYSTMASSPVSSSDGGLSLPETTTTTTTPTPTPYYRRRASISSTFEGNARQYGNDERYSSSGGDDDDLRSALVEILPPPPPAPASRRPSKADVPQTPNRHTHIFTESVSSVSSRESVAISSSGIGGGGGKNLAQSSSRGSAAGPRSSRHYIFPPRPGPPPLGALPSRPPHPNSSSSVTATDASFSALLLSHKSVLLPRQPFPQGEVGVGAAPAALSTLVQLQVAGSTYIITAESLERHGASSALALFISSCIEMNDSRKRSSHTDGTFSDCEMDDDIEQMTKAVMGSPLPRSNPRWSLDSDTLRAPPCFSPPHNLNIPPASIGKLQRLGVLPPSPPRELDPQPLFFSHQRSKSVTPRAEKFTSLGGGGDDRDGGGSSITASSLISPPSSSTSTSSSCGGPRPSFPSRRPLPPLPPRRPSTTFLNVLLLRSASPYPAIVHFLSSGELLPALRFRVDATLGSGGDLMVQTSPTCCSQCGGVGSSEAQRLLRLRELEAEARWLGLVRLERICRSERRRKDARSLIVTDLTVTGSGLRRAAPAPGGEGWI